MGLTGAVPLEFDEEDEDFVGHDALDVPGYTLGQGDSSVSRETSRDGPGAEVECVVGCASGWDHAAQGDDGRGRAGGDGGGSVGRMG